jgi:hypothetical protein
MFILQSGHMWKQITNYFCNINIIQMLKPFRVLSLFNMEQRLLFESLNIGTDSI